MQDVVIPHVDMDSFPVFEEAPEAPADAPRTLIVAEGIARDVGSPSPDTLFFRFRKLVPDYNGLLNLPQDPDAPEPRSAVSTRRWRCVRVCIVMWLSSSYTSCSRDKETESIRVCAVSGT